jgi:hypothetical protein
MANIRISDKEFIEIVQTSRSWKEASERMNMENKNVMKRRRNLEAKYNIALNTITHPNNETRKQYHLQTAHRHSPRLNLGVENGTVLVFSDAHFYPGLHSSVFKGLLWAIKQFSPVAVIANGDVFDGATISRHPRIGWDSKPSVIEELKACEIAMGEIEEAAKKARRNVKLIWPLGNHDARFENFLAANAPQYEHVKGFSLKDHFPAWTPCWSCWINDDTVVKHRFKGGIHATHNNTLWSGKNIVTGHLHSLKVSPITDYNGVRYGVDSGTLADIDGPQFRDYLEENPTNWRSGFVVLTFYKGKLLFPELVMKFNNEAIEFRGQVIQLPK